MSRMSTRLAAARMAQEKPDQTLQATALVHEAYVRLVDTEKAQHWNSRGHFFAAGEPSPRSRSLTGLVTSPRRSVCAPGTQVCSL
jgi:hypothetical protein